MGLRKFVNSRFLGSLEGKSSTYKNWDGLSRPELDCLKVFMQGRFGVPLCDGFMMAGMGSTDWFTRREGVWKEISSRSALWLRL